MMWGRGGEGDAEIPRLGYEVIILDWSLLQILRDRDIDR